VKKTKRKPAPLSTILIAGAIIMFWRGVWGLLDVYLFPSNPTLSYSLSFLISLLLYIFVVRHHVKDLA
jgi:hypothetical protein